MGLDSQRHHAIFLVNTLVGTRTANILKDLRMDADSFNLFWGGIERKKHLEEEEKQAAVIKVNDTVKLDNRGKIQKEKYQY